MQTLGSVGDAAGEGAVAIIPGKYPGGDAGSALFENGRSLNGRQLAQFLAEGGGVDATDAQGHGAGPFGLLAQLLGGAVGDNLAAIDDDGPRTRRIDFLEDVGRENDR